MADVARPPLCPQCGGDMIRYGDKAQCGSCGRPADLDEQNRAVRQKQTASAVLPPPPPAKRKVK